MTDQARHIYKTVVSESIVNIETIKQEIEVDKLDYNNYSNREEDDEINPYHEIIANKEKGGNTLWVFQYSWLDPSNERKYMTDQEILDKYIELENMSNKRKEGGNGNVIQV